MGTMGRGSRRFSGTPRIVTVELKVRSAPGCGIERVYIDHAPLLRRVAIRKFGVPSGEADTLVHDVFAAYIANPGAVRNDQERQRISNFYSRNAAFRAIGRAAGSPRLTGGLRSFGDKATPALAVFAVGTLAYNASTMVQCHAGLLE